MQLGLFEMSHSVPWDVECPIPKRVFVCSPPPSANAAATLEVGLALPPFPLLLLRQYQYVAQAGLDLTEINLPLPPDGWV